MTEPSVHIQVDPTSVPSTPTWFGEVAVVAHTFQQLGLVRAIEERVRLSRARMGKMAGHVWKPWQWLVLQRTAACAHRDRGVCERDGSSAFPGRGPSGRLAWQCGSPG